MWEQEKRLTVEVHRSWKTPVEGILEMSIGEWVGFLLVEKVEGFWAGGRSGSKQISLDVWPECGGIYDWLEEGYAMKPEKAGHI